MENLEKYNNGPDQIILEANKIWVSEADGFVKIRDHDKESLIRTPPLSVPSLLKKTASELPDQQVMCFKLTTTGWELKLRTWSQISSNKTMFKGS